MHFHKHNFWCFWFERWDNTGWGEVLLWFLRSRPRVSVYHFVTCNPPILLPGSLFAMIFLSPGLVGLLITEIIISLRTLCDRVTRWLSLFRLSIKCHLIVEWLSGLVELPSSALVLVGWAEYSRLRLNCSLAYLVFLGAFSYLLVALWSFLNITHSFIMLLLYCIAFGLPNVLSEYFPSCLRALLVLSKY